MYSRNPDSLFNLPQLTTIEKEQAYKAYGPYEPNPDLDIDQDCSVWAILFNDGSFDFRHGYWDINTSCLTSEMQAMSCIYAG